MQFSKSAETGSLTDLQDVHDAQPTSPLGLLNSKAKGTSLLTRFLIYICSVRLGVILLAILGSLSFVGMIITQQGVDGFAAYYTSLTPAQQAIYEKLDLFNIYNSSYFSLVLYALSLNIVLATIDRFPKVWRYISTPAISVPVRWLRDQNSFGSFSIDPEDPDKAINEIKASFTAVGLPAPKVQEKSGETYVFTQTGAWNRLAFCAVHLALLTIFLGYFLTSRLAESGSISLSPGRSTNIMFDTAFGLGETTEIAKKLPFTITFTDTQNVPIDPRGPLVAENSLNWKTAFSITDETGIHQAEVELNRPFDYRGYRFFQSSMSNVGRARKIRVEVTTNGGASRLIEIPRDGTVSLEDGTEVLFSGFRANFRSSVADINEDSSSYPNPAAILNIQVPDAAVESFVFPSPRADENSIGRAVGPHYFRLVDYERVAHEHTLAIRRDPGSGVLYVGFAFLAFSLAGVFFFSHKRFWVVIKPNAERTEILYSGETNRNIASLEIQFARLGSELRKRLKERSLD
jgi:cytochrome c biogenesis protein